MNEVIWTELDEIALRAERRGERKGRVKQLLLQLAARFGTVPPEITAKVEAANQRLLEQWAVRVLTATTLEEVIAGGNAGGKDDTSSRRGAVTRKAPTRTRAARSARVSQSRG